MKKIGIYGIFCIPRNKVYIGQSINITKRWEKHRHMLKYNKHYNPHLQNAYNIYGPNCFHYQILEECNQEDLDKREEYWITDYDTINNEKGYNICIGYKPKRKLEETKPRSVKKVVIIDAKTGEYIETKNGVKQLCDDYGFKRSRVLDVLYPSKTSPKYSHKGFIFVHEELYDSSKNYIHVRKERAKEKKIRKHKKQRIGSHNSIPITVEYNNEIKEYPSVFEAGRQLIIKPRYIYRAIEKREGKYKEYIFKINFEI